MADLADLPDVTADALAALVGCRTARIGELVRAGAIPKAARGRFRLAEAVPAYVRHVTANPVGRPRKADDPTDPATRLKAAQAEREELRLARDRGELLDAAEVRAEWTGIVTDLRAQLLGVPARVAASVGAEAATAAALEEEMRRALADVAEEVGG